MSSAMQEFRLPTAYSRTGRCGLRVDPQICRRRGCAKWHSPPLAVAQRAKGLSRRQRPAASVPKTASSPAGLPGGSARRRAEVASISGFARSRRSRLTVVDLASQSWTRSKDAARIPAMPTRTATASSATGSVGLLVQPLAVRVRDHGSGRCSNSGVPVAAAARASWRKTHPVRIRTLVRGPPACGMTGPPGANAQPLAEAAPEVEVARSSRCPSAVARSARLTTWRRSRAAARVPAKN
mmetsp:Transcript_56435/g.121969  ORF Transcript_56435/g.121969 Transcript_56435/m.121969 type:complete len:239 (+) Transcript_56435:2755-3471(+)